MIYEKALFVESSPLSTNSHAVDCQSHVTFETPTAAALDALSDFAAHIKLAGLIRGAAVKQPPAAALTVAVLVNFIKDLSDGCSAALYCL